MLARQGDNFDPHLDQTKLNGLLPLTIDGVLYYVVVLVQIVLLQIILLMSLFISCNLSIGYKLLDPESWGG